MNLVSREKAIDVAIDEYNRGYKEGFEAGKASVSGGGDLISRQAAIYAVTVGALSSATIYGRTDAGMTALRETIRAIKALPSTQPEIIRCKDCKHYDDGLCRRWKYSHVTSEDSFCSGAERRNGWEE